MLYYTSRDSSREQAVGFASNRLDVMREKARKYTLLQKGFQPVKPYKQRFL